MEFTTEEQFLPQGAKKRLITYPTLFKDALFKALVARAANDLSLDIKKDKPDAWKRFAKKIQTAIKRVGPTVKKNIQRANSQDTLRFDDLSQKKVQGKPSDLEHMEWLRIKRNLQTKELDEINMLRIQAKERNLRSLTKNRC